MNKYDYHDLIQRVYAQGITKEGLTIDILDEIKNVIETDKIDVNCVFGIGYYSEYGGDILCAFISNMEDWKDEKCCSDYIADDVYKILTTIGFVEQEDAIWSTGNWVFTKDGQEKINQFTREEIFEKLSKVGFYYDKEFEEMMMDV